MKYVLRILLTATFFSFSLSCTSATAQSASIGSQGNSSASTNTEDATAQMRSVNSAPQNSPQTPSPSPQVVSPLSVPGQKNLYCTPDSTAEESNIRVRRALVDPKEASDSYGRRLGRRFIVFEVTVENTSPTLQYLLHDVSVDFSLLYKLPLGTYWWAFSSQDLIMLRGVPEKGADYDPRNLTLHVMQGTGAVAGGVSGLTSTAIQDLYGGVTAAFNGPLLAAFGGIFPDHTATQLNRLSDSAFTVNTVIAKQSAKTFAIFVPERLFMTHAEQNSYWKEPRPFFDNNPQLDFRHADVCVDGTFISEVPPVTLTAVAYDDPKSVKAGANVNIDLTGANFSSSDTLVDLSLDSATSTISLSSVTSDGTTATAIIKLPSSWTTNSAVTVGVESKATGQKTPPLPLAVSQPPAAPTSPPAAGSSAAPPAAPPTQ